MNITEDNFLGVKIRKVVNGNQCYYELTQLCQKYLKVELNGFLDQYKRNVDFVELVDEVGPSRFESTHWGTWDVLIDTVFQSRTEEGRILKKCLSGKVQSQMSRGSFEENVETSQIPYLMANISHDLRTPLNGSMGALELLSRTELSEDQRDLLTILADSLDQLSIETEHVIEVVHLSLEKPKLVLETFNPTSTVKDVVQSFSRSAAFRNKKINLKIPDLEPTKYMGDAKKLKQVTKNFTALALKHSSSTTLNIQCSIVPDYKLGKMFLCFEVNDTQTTLLYHFENSTTAQQRQSKIIKEFSMCKMLTELMNGEIGLNLKQSFVCWFRIPLIPVPYTTEMKEISPKKPFYHLLVVEDNLVNQKIVCKLLSQQPIPLKIDTAINGQMGLDMMTKIKYDLVLMDCQMPIMDGFEAVKRYREFEANTKALKTPIIAFTAQSLSSEQQKCYDVGMCGLLTKPIRPKELENILLTWLPV